LTAISLHGHVWYYEQGGLKKAEDFFNLPLAYR